jgi:hypothetical protein
MIARAQDLPCTANPVFLHRRFRHGFVFLNTSKGITKPADLIGRKVGLRNFSATAQTFGFAGFLNMNIKYRTVKFNGLNRIKKR